MGLAPSCVNSVYKDNVLKYRDLAPLGAAIFTLVTAPSGYLAHSAPTGAVRPAPEAPPDSAVFSVDPSSVLEVHAGKSGLLAGFGHEHRVRAHAFFGAVTYFPDDLGRSRVTLTVLTDSLRVVPEADSADIPKITEAMRTSTLRVDSFPEIVFSSREVTPLEEGRRGSGRSRSSIRMAGDLTMVGRTRPVSVDLELAVRADTLRAEGSFVVKQTDFGIKPYSKALGMVKVKDEVRFELHVVAATHPAAPGQR